MRVFSCTFLFWLSRQVGVCVCLAMASDGQLLVWRESCVQKLRQSGGRWSGAAPGACVRQSSAQENGRRGRRRTTAVPLTGLGLVGVWRGGDPIRRAADYKRGSKWGRRHAGQGLGGHVWQTTPFVHDRALQRRSMARRPQGPDANSPAGLPTALPRVPVHDRSS